MQFDKRTLSKSLKFITPAIILVAIYLLYPALRTIAGSLFMETTFSKPRWNGLNNFVYLLKNRSFLQATLFTVSFTVVSVALETVLGVILALIMNSHMESLAHGKLRGLIRGIILLPWVIPSVIAARIWQLIYQYDYGLANWFLTLLGVHRINFLGKASSAFFALVTADVWRTAPFVAIIVLAGLQSIPQEVLKQSLVDGATPLKRFFKVILPLISPILFVAILFRSVDALRVFDLIYIITSGGPGGSTSSLSILGYRFFTSGDYGLGNATSAILFVMALITATLVLRLLKKQSLGES